MPQVTSTNQLKDLLRVVGGPLDYATVKNISIVLGSARFVDGRLAHVEYGTLREDLGEERFLGIWEVMGVSRERFLNYDHTTCSGGICFPNGNSFCDPAACGHH